MRGCKYKAWLFVLAVVAYGANKVFLVFAPLGANLPPFLSSHFNDVLLAPVVLPAIMRLLELTGFRQRLTAPRVAEVLVPVAVWSVIFEAVGPYVFGFGTADPVDVVCYVAGGIITWCVWQSDGKSSGKLHNSSLQPTTVPLRGLPAAELKH